MVSISAANAAKGSPGYRSIRRKVTASTINLMRNRPVLSGCIHIEESGDAGGRAIFGTVARTLRNSEQCEGRPRPRTRGKRDRYEKSRPVPFSARAESESLQEDLMKVFGKRKN